MTGCAGVFQKINPKAYKYRKDLLVEINGHKFVGVGVPPKADKYQIHIEHYDKMHNLTIETCHRNISLANPFYKKRIFKKRKEYRFVYSPEDVEEECLMEITTSNKTKSFAFALFDFPDPKHTLPAKIRCNGKIWDSKGTSMCQSGNGLVQVIEFQVPTVNKGAFCGDLTPEIPLAKIQWDLKKGVCQYIFVSQDGRSHKLTTYGFNLDIIRDL